MCRWHAKDEALDADKDWASISNSNSNSNSQSGVRTQLHATHHQLIQCVVSENQLREAFYLTFDLVSKNFN